MKLNTGFFLNVVKRMFGSCSCDMMNFPFAVDSKHFGRFESISTKSSFLVMN